MAQQKVVIKIPAMADEKTKKKAIEAAADIYGMALVIKKQDHDS